MSNENGCITIIAFDDTRPRRTGRVGNGLQTRSSLSKGFKEGRAKNRALYSG